MEGKKAKVSEWKYCTGELLVQVKAIDDEGRFRFFDLRTYRSDEVSCHDFIENMDDLLRASAHLRNCYKPEIVSVEEVRHE